MFMYFIHDLKFKNGFARDYNVYGNHWDVFTLFL